MRQGSQIGFPPHIPNKDPQSAENGSPQAYFRPKKQLGQNFLRQKSVLNKIIAAANLKKTDIVLEIGPGEGILTEALAVAAGKVIAVEKDHRLIPILKEKFKSIENVKIVDGDALELVSSIEYLVSSIKNQASSSNTKYPPSLKLRRAGKIHDTQYKVVANLPYYAATHIIRLFLELPNSPELMVLMVQKEVAQRIVAKPPHMNLLAVSVQFYAEPKIISYVPKNAFWPKPKVDSAIIHLKLKAQSEKRKVNDELFFKIVKAGFSQPRKILLNNLSHGLKIPKNEINEKLMKIGISPDCRPENLFLKDWLGIIECVKI